jgi:hypothetical protein
MAEAAIRECKELWSCGTLGDLGGGDRLNTLHGVVGGVRYGEMRSGFPKVALSNYSLERMDETHGLEAYFTSHR